MTIDKERLKALAEAATQGEWKFDGGTVNDWCDGEYSMEWMPNGEDCEDGTNANWKADGSYIAAANPSAILALLAEIEGLHAQHGRDSGELRKLCSARDSARRQRDQLKAENEALRKDAENWKTVQRAMEQLKSDEQCAAIWSVCSRVLISLASDLNSACSVVTEEGVTKDWTEIGDWRVTVERLAVAKEP